MRRQDSVRADRRAGVPAGAGPVGERRRAAAGTGFELPGRGGPQPAARTLSSGSTSCRCCCGTAGCGCGGSEPDRELSLAAGHMLNAAASPPLCRQLLELASDGMTSLAPFDWGPLATMPFLPRVRSGRVVLHPAQWRLGCRAKDGLAGVRGRARFDALASGLAGPVAAAPARLPHPGRQPAAARPGRCRAPRAAPRSRCRSAPAHRRAPGGSAGARRRVAARPARPARGRAGGPVVRVVRRPGRPTRARPAAGRGRRSRQPRWPDTDRLRPPGSDWLYVILSGPRATEDALLAGSLGALADRLVEQGDADGWFFVRYADPDRAAAAADARRRRRAHRPGAARAEPDGRAEAIAEGSRTRLSLETYERELERYGGPVTTGLCERIACADSHAVRLLLACAPRLPGSAARRGGRCSGPSVFSRSPRPSGTGPGEHGRPGGVADPPSVSLAPRPRDARPSRPGPVPCTASGKRICARSSRRSRRPGPVRRRTPRPRYAADSTVAGHAARVSPTAGRDWLPSSPSCRSGAGTGPASRTVEQLLPSLVHMHANRLGLNQRDEQLMLGLLDRTLRSIRAHP